MKSTFRFFYVEIFLRNHVFGSDNYSATMLNFQYFLNDRGFAKQTEVVPIVKSYHMHIAYIQCVTI